MCTTHLLWYCLVIQDTLVYWSRPITSRQWMGHFLISLWCQYSRKRTESHAMHNQNIILLLYAYHEIIFRIFVDGGISNGSCVGQHCSKPVGYCLLWADISLLFCTWNPCNKGHVFPRVGTCIICQSGLLGSYSGHPQRGRHCNLWRDKHFCSTFISVSFNFTTSYRCRSINIIPSFQIDLPGSSNQRAVTRIGNI